MSSLMPAPLQGSKDVSDDIRFLMVEFEKDKFASDFMARTAKLITTAKAVTGGNSITAFIHQTFKGQHISAELKIILEELVKCLTSRASISLSFMLASHDVYTASNGNSIIEDFSNVKTLFTNDIQTLMAEYGIANTLRILDILYIHSR